MIENFYLMSFLWGLWWSYVFSLPPGIINLSVLDATVKKGLKYGIYLALAACIVEFLQSFLGAKFTAFFLESPRLAFAINIAIIPVFLFLGINYFRKAYRIYKNKKNNVVPIETKKRVGSFGKGLIVGLLNPIAIPFFIVLATKTKDEGLLKDTWPSILIYVAGTTVGTFLAFFTYGILSKFIAKRLQAIRFWLDIIIGVVFSILVINQSVIVVLKYIVK